MGYYLKYEGVDEPESLATTTGWGDVRRYLSGVHPDTAPCLNQLVNMGWEQDLADLEKEIPTVIKAKQPKADVESTLTGLLKLLKARPADCACVLVTNGMSSDTDD